MESKSWDSHYTRSRSALQYPDENLVRLLSKALPALQEKSSVTAVDLGCGSGRHLKLLADMGVEEIIGLDTSYGALRLSGNAARSYLVQGNNRALPLKNDCVDIIIAWGSLHYNEKSDLPAMLAEIRRIMKKDGHLLATLRSSRDTYLKKGRHLGNDTWITDLRDISGSIASFYDETELKHELAMFRDVTYGLMERTILGDLSSLISHWVIHARK